MLDVLEIKTKNPLDTTVESLTGQKIIRHKIACPWRNDGTPSLHVYEDGHWWDYGSGTGGDVLDFVGYFYFGTAYNPEIHFIEVVDKLGELGIRPLPQQSTKPKPQKSKTTLSLDSIRHWHDSMPESRREYWYTRGLLDPTIDSFLLGWDGKRYTIPFLYRNIAYGVKRRRSEIDDGLDAKYVMTKGSRAGLFNADVLWTCNSVIICEGEIDCALLNQYEFPAVSSTAGAGTWKVEWARFFSHIQRIWILYDNDEAGRVGAKRVQSSLRRASIINLPPGIKDVGELVDEVAFPVMWLKGNIA